MTYIAMYKGDQRSTLISSIVMLSQECCDFSRMFDISAPAAAEGAGSSPR